MHAIPRIGQPPEITAPALFLASHEASYVTGAEFAVAGSWRAGRIQPALPGRGVPPIVDQLDQHVAHAGDPSPGHLGMFRTKIGGRVLHRLADDLPVANYGILGLRVVEERLPPSQGCGLKRDHRRAKQAR